MLLLPLLLFFTTDIIDGDVAAVGDYLVTAATIDAGVAAVIFLVVAVDATFVATTAIADIVTAGVTATVLYC